jgi:preprotein translocase subunit YajC
MMLISKAYAAAEAVTGTPPMAPGAGEAFLWNMGLVVVLVVLFYVLLIMPQQKRFKEHSVMLAGLKKGDKVLIAGGLIGVIDKITDGDDEVVVDLGDGVKVTALRATLQGRDTALLYGRPANANSQKTAGNKK